MNENERMAELLLPDITKTPDYYEELYKPRNLPEGARVTRVAPSPPDIYTSARFSPRL